MKTREPRRRVMIKARMRVGASWGDVCILNISSRGLLLQAATPPPRGTYLEVCRGRHVIVARVAWTKHHRLGVRTQEALPVEQIIEEPDSSTAEHPKAAPIAAAVERRSSPRNLQVRHQKSRVVARTMEFACIAIFAATAAVMAFEMLEKTFARPLPHVSAALAPR